MMRRTLSGLLTALILTTAAPMVSPALPAAAAPYVKTGETSAPVLAKETVKFVKKGSMTYCLTSDGTQKTGWVSRSGKWYYFDKKDGHMLTGWLKLKTRKFYLKADGSMVQGPRWYNVGGKRYYFTSNGHVRSAWEKIGGKWYFRDTEGDLVRNEWLLYNGKYYYLTSTGATATGTATIEGKKYTFTNDGALKGTLSVKLVAESKLNANKLDAPVYASDKKTSDETSAEKQTDTKKEDSGKEKAPSQTETAPSTEKKSSEKKTSSSKTTTTATTKKNTASITKVKGKLNELPESKRKFVIQIANYVRKYAPKYGIKVYSPIIAQAIHESGWGESSLSAKYHNYFGLKCGTLWTGKSVNLSTKEEYSAGTLTTIRSNFRVYDNMEQGVKGYFEFIQLPRYSNLKGVTSPRQYLTNIKNDGYATGYLYVDHTMALVDLYELTQFDK